MKTYNTTYGPFSREAALPASRVWVRALLLAAVALMLTAAPQAAAQNTFDVVKEASSFRIEGTSTVNSFTCRTGEVDGRARLSGDPLRTVAEESRPTPMAQVAVPAGSFDCGKSRMNKDFYEALKAEAYPTIRYELHDAQLISGVQAVRGKADAGPIKIAADGMLTIAGEQRPVHVVAEGQSLGEGLYRLTGSVPLRMTDFGVEPPTALLGLVKAHDDIEVHFEIVAACELLVAQAEREGLSHWTEFAQVQEQPECIQ